jgi:nitroimidazol reductase NimA-like FMN-containing flavoprotein (pyridoxamine 5'-phosphate oxidase superfamily)
MSTNNLATLVAYDCWNLLEDADIARIAWQSGDGIGLVPVNYVVADGALWFRTDAASVLARECGGQVVVVEVDQVDSETGAGWSVVVKGTAELIDVRDVPEMLVEMRVWAGGPRSLFIRIEPVHVTGRRVWKS